MNTEPAVDLTEAEAAARDAHESELQAAREAQEAAEAEARRQAEETARANDPVEQARIAAENERAAAEAERERLAAATAEAERAAAEARAAAEQLAAERERAQAAPTRDFAAELSALEQQFDDGDLTQAEFRAKERDIIAAQAIHDHEASQAEQRRQEAERNAQQAEQTAAQQWQSAQEQFFADPGNRSLVDGAIKQAAFGAAVAEAAKVVPAGSTYLDVLTKARELVTGVAAVDPKAEEARAAAERNRNQPDAATSLRDVPNASHETGNVPGASLDNLEIGDLEDRLSRMSAADREAYLANAPGGLRDNSRAVA